MVEIETTEAKAQVRVGKLKWFSNAKGFGFLTCADFERDVLLHANVLGKYSGRVLPDDADVEFLCIEGEQGPKVTEVVSMVLTYPEDLGFLPEEMATITLQPARVKWFDLEKGYGFANCFGVSDDIFLHSSVVNKFGQWFLHQGEALSLRVKETDRGLIAVDVRPWDEAIAEV